MVIGIAMVRDEADIIETTVRNMLCHVDQVLVLDNRSTDGTREILESLPDTDVIFDPEPGYYQSAKMTRLAQTARSAGADWVVPFDADEIWVSRPGGRIADVLESLPAEAMVAEAALFDHVVTGVDEDHGSPVQTMTYRRAAQAPLRKVACRAHENLIIHQGNHSAAIGNEPFLLAAPGLLEVRHFPYRSVDQFIQKARNGAEAYAASDLPEEAGAHWRGYGKILDEQGEAACGAIFRKWFYYGDPENPPEHLPPLVRDPAPCKSK